MSYTPIELSRRAAAHLTERGLENARLDAELLLAHVLGLRRLDLYLQHDRPLTDDEVEAFRALVRRRLAREPLQYITGTAHFRELVLAVDRRVLIPRPETEVLVGAVLEWARARVASSGLPAGRRSGAAAAEAASRTAPCAGGLAALDVGTGSGAIALSLAREGAFRRVVATDVSPDALALAAQNAGRTGLADRVELRRGAGFGPLEPGERFDVIVSNPPYVAESEREALPPEVRDWEPAGALFAGDDGLAVVYDLIDGSGEWLAPGGLLALEVGAGQTARVAARIEAAGGHGAARVVRDLAGRERIVLAERQPLANAGEKRQHPGDFNRREP